MSLAHASAGYLPPMSRAKGLTQCPMCGKGTLVDVIFDTAPERGEAPHQRADSIETSIYSCRHEVSGPSLATADGDALAVERRRSEDTVEPVTDGAGAR